MNVCRRFGPWATALLAALVRLPALAAQSGPTYWAAGSGTLVRARSVFAAGSTTLNGPAFGVEGGITKGRVSLRVGYGEGALRVDAGGGAAGRRGYVEGFALVGGMPVGGPGGLVIEAGPHARAYATDSGTERWLFWELRTRYEVPIVGPLISGSAELWGALSGTVNVVEAFRSARGGAAAILIRPVSGPLVVTLRYAIDEARLRGARRETVEGVTLTVGYSRR